MLLTSNKTPICGGKSEILAQKMNLHAGNVFHGVCHAISKYSKGNILYKCGLASSTILLLQRCQHAAPCAAVPTPISGCSLMPSWQSWQRHVFTSIMNAALALALFIPASPANASDMDFSSSPRSPHPQEQVAAVASEAEDRLLEAARQLEARLASAFNLASESLNIIPGSESTQDTDKVNAQAREMIQEVWELVDQKYLDARSNGFNREHWAELRDRALSRPYKDIRSAYGAIREMMADALHDPYCRFVTPAEMEAMKKYDMTGVGLNLGTSEEYERKLGLSLPDGRGPGGAGVFVIGITSNSPAQSAGLTQGDELLSVDGRPVADQTPFQIASLLQSFGTEEADPGSLGTGLGYSAKMVKVKVQKPDGSTLETRIEVPRVLLPSPVTYRLGTFPDIAPRTSAGVGIIKLTSFNARAQRDLAAAVGALEKAGVGALVLDLRDNRGGLVSEGLEVARLFLGDDVPLVRYLYRGPMPPTPTASGSAITSRPLLVLVNEHTASASEIVAGALRDNCRAALAGTRTYGKGLVQTVYQLSEGSALVLTVGKYITPAGEDIDRLGLQPDFYYPPSAAQLESFIDACRIQKAAKVNAAMGIES